MTTKQHYEQAAQSLPRGELKAQFGVSSLDDENAAVNRIHEKASDLNQVRHNYTVAGNMTGEDKSFGQMKTNAANNGNTMGSAGRGKDKAAKKKDDMSFWLHQYMNGLRKDLDEINLGIQAVNELEKLYRHGQLDFTDPKTQRLMKTAGLSQEQIEKNGLNAFDNRKTVLQEEKIKKEQQLDQASNLSERLNANDPSAMREVEQLKQSVEGEWQITRSMRDVQSVEQAEKLDIEMGYEGKNLELAQSVTVKTDEMLDNFFDEPVSVASTSFASSLDDNNGIKTGSIRGEFAKVSDPNYKLVEQQPHIAATPDVKFDIPKIG